MTELTDVQLAAVGQTLAGHGVVLDGPLSSTLIDGGRSNLTFRLDDARASWVLRMPPRAGRTPSAHDVAREYRITRALKHTEVPVAPATALCEDESLIGSPFAVWGFVEGRSIQSRDDLDALDDVALASVTSRLIETLVSLHELDPHQVGLGQLGRPDGYAERQLRRWSQQWELVAGDDPAALRDAAVLSQRLREAVPKQRTTSIVHGDFRIDNTLLATGVEPTVLAVLDWELSTLGDPVADVAMMCAYRHPSFDLIVGSPSAWTSPRLPEPTELAQAYESAGGARLVDWDFHLALAHFKIAVIAAGIAHRHRAGVGAGPGFDSAEQAVAPHLAAGLAATHARW